jgi:uncharacterized membrane protein HdeD (DUF308 family)
MTSSEIRFVILAALLWVLPLVVFFDPFDSLSHRSRAAASLVFGPMMIIYGIAGMSRGGFPEMADATREGSRWKYWFCAASFVVGGFGGFLVGLHAIGVFS